jgi:hypothetical protein
MKTKSSDRITLSDKAYYTYYEENNFFSLFISSLVQSRSIIPVGISLCLAIAGFFLIDITHIDKPREFISVVSAGLTTYSITTMGFLLVSFTMLMILNSSKSFFRYFALEDSNYKKPLIRILLGFFIIPIGIFSFLLVFSMATNFMSPVFSVNQFNLNSKILIFKTFIGIAVFLFVLSLSELFSFFYNLYNFIVITSYDMAKNFELDIIIQSGVLSEISEDDGSNEIKQNINEFIKRSKEKMESFNAP